MQQAPAKKHKVQHSTCIFQLCIMTHEALEGYILFIFLLFGLFRIIEISKEEVQR